MENALGTTAQDIMVFCKSEGFLAKQLYVVLTTPVAGLAAVREQMQAHLDFQIELERKGILFGAGPFFSEDGLDWAGEGMVIIRATSLAQAHEIAASDPMHKSGARVFQLRPWVLNEGSFTLQVSYSDGRCQMV